MRKIIILLLSCTVLLLIGYAGLRGYRVWKRGHMMSLAREFAAKNDIRNTLLSLQQILRSDPKHVEASRLMAEIAEANGLPDAFIWRSRVVEAAPDSTDDRLALARIALGVRDLTSASNALDGIRVEGKNTAGYHNLAGTLAVAAGQILDAESHFTEAARLAPTNPVPRLNLAVLGLVGTNQEQVVQSRAKLEALSAEPQVSCQALRELVNHSIRSGLTNDAVAFSTRLIQQTNSTFVDKLVRLDILRGTKDPEFEPQLRAAKTEASSDRAKIQAMGTWLLTRPGPADALAWLNSMPPETRTNQPAAMLAADCYLALNDWPGLQADIEKQNWEAMDFLRHAFLARAMRGQELESSAKTEWEIALRKANGRRETLTMLLRLAAAWRWTSDAEQILWTFCTEFPRERWAPFTLGQLLHSLGRTDALLRLYTQLNRANPNDILVKNNLAVLALLTDSQQVKAHDLARQVYENSPTNASFVSTYAFSLFRQEKVSEALELIQKLEPEELERPSIAAYYGVFLQATGNSEKAKKYFDIAAKTTLLPEERKLVERAQGL